MQNVTESIKDITLQPGECITSYDVRTLLTSVPVETALDIISSRLIKDQNLTLRTKVIVQHIIEIHTFCPHSIYFLFQGKYYKQVEGATMDSPVSPILANSYMEHFEEKALKTAQNAPRLWKWFCG